MNARNLIEVSANLKTKNSKRCQVCFEDCDGEDLTLCNICNISVHRSCYMGENEEMDKTVGWKCDPCKCDVDFCATICRVCPVKGGAFKKIFGVPNDWVHLPCVSIFRRSEHTSNLQFATRKSMLSSLLTARVHQHLCFLCCFRLYFVLIS